MKNRIERERERADKNKSREKKIKINLIVCRENERRTRSASIKKFFSHFYNFFFHWNLNEMFGLLAENKSRKFFLICAIQFQCIALLLYANV